MSERVLPPRVYLRVCGVTRLAGVCCYSSSGLSPRVRSYPSSAVPATVSAGSISACAELPDTRRSRRKAPRVYLRVCGVTPPPPRPFPPARGLSPRVRSYRHKQPRRQVHRGSISACAELSKSGCLRSGRPWVYLRVCGVILEALPDDLPAEGSISACAELSLLQYVANGLGEMQMTVHEGNDGAILAEQPLETRSAPRSRYADEQDMQTRRQRRQGTSHLKLWLRATLPWPQGRFHGFAYCP